MSEQQFLFLIKNCVYKNEKALEISDKLRELGEVWFTFKRDLLLKARQGTTVEKQARSLKSRDKMLNLSSTESNDNIVDFGIYKMELLLRLLPFWDITLNEDIDEAINVKFLDHIKYFKVLISSCYIISLHNILSYDLFNLYLYNLILIIAKKDIKHLNYSSKWTL